MSTGVHGAAAAPAQSPSSPFWMQVDGGSQTLGVTGRGKLPGSYPAEPCPVPSKSQVVPAPRSHGKAPRRTTRLLSATWAAQPGDTGQCNLAGWHQPSTSAGQCAWGGAAPTSHEMCVCTCVCMCVHVYVCACVCSAEPCELLLPVTDTKSPNDTGFSQEAHRTQPGGSQCATHMHACVNTHMLAHTCTRVRARVHTSKVERCAHGLLEVQGSLA